MKFKNRADVREKVKELFNEAMSHKKPTVERIEKAIDDIMEVVTSVASELETEENDG